MPRQQAYAGRPACPPSFLAAAAGARLHSMAVAGARSQMAAEEDEEEDGPPGLDSAGEEQEGVGSYHSDSKPWGGGWAAHGCGNATAGAAQHGAHGAPPACCTMGLLGMDVLAVERETHECAVEASL